MRLLALMLLVDTQANLGAEDAPRFLPESRSGIQSKTLPLEWDTKQNVRWKTPIPGNGWSCPVVHGRLVFLTTAVSDEKQAEPREGLYITDLNGKPAKGTHRWQVYCLDAATGRVVWSRTPFEGAMSTTIHIKNSLASETPVTDGKHVWAYFGNVGLACYDVSGKLLWSQKTPKHKTRMGWGTGASPALHDGKLFVVHDNEEKSFLMALDAKTGKEFWKVDRDEKSNWGTPYIWTNSLRTELVTAGTSKTRSYSLDGKLLWELKGMSVISIPTPFAMGDRLCVSSGYVLDPYMRPVYSIKPGARGDISLKEDETSNAFIVWSQKQAGSYHPTPIVTGERLYVLHDRGYVAGYDTITGKETLPRQRISPNANAFTASPWAYNGHLFCLAEDGTTYAMKVSDTGATVVHRNKLGEMALATPVVAGGSLFVRTRTALYCIRSK